MIVGLPWQSWLLLLAAVGLGLAIELRFFLAHRRGSSAHHDRDDRERIP